MRFRGRPARTVAALGAIAALVVTLAACAASSHSTPSPTTAAGQSTASAGPVCTGSATTRTMDVAGLTRTFVEHVPTGFSATTTYPAIIAFPGRGETAGELAGYSQLDTVNAIVLYAQGLAGAGNEPTWEATPYLGASAHDYEFAADLVHWLANASCVNPHQIDFAGKSDGAGFAASAACDITGVAAVATISGAFYQADNHCAADGHRLAILNMHGTADLVIPYAGNPARGLYSTDAWLGLWRQRDRCTGSPVDTSIAADVTESAWSSCADGTEVVNYRIAGGGHTWPGATTTSGPGVTTDSIDAAQTMAAFFAAHPLPRAEP